MAAVCARARRRGRARLRLGLPGPKWCHIKCIQRYQTKRGAQLHPSPSHTNTQAVLGILFFLSYVAFGDVALPPEAQRHARAPRANRRRAVGEKKRGMAARSPCTFSARFPGPGTRSPAACDPGFGCCLFVSPRAAAVISRDTELGELQWCEPLSETSHLGETIVERRTDREMARCCADKDPALRPVPGLPGLVVGR